MNGVRCGEASVRGAAPGDAIEDVEIEDAMMQLEAALTNAVSPTAMARAHEAAIALRNLETSLRRRRDLVEHVIDDNRRSTHVFNAIERHQAQLDSLACRAEALSARTAISSSLCDVRGAIHRLVADVESMLAEEAHLVLDAYWVDLGVGD